MVYAPLQVPELLGTEDYLHALAAADLCVPEGMEALRVEATLTHRQPRLHGRQPDLTVVIGEAALKQQVGSSSVMREQLKHLAQLGGEHAWLTIRMLPFASGATPGGDAGAFSLLQFSEMPGLGLIHVAGPTGGMCLDDAGAIAAYARTFNQLTWYTLTREQSQAKFFALASKLSPRHTSHSKDISPWSLNQCARQARRRPPFRVPVREK
jgi:hypothetical protein